LKVKILVYFRNGPDLVIDTNYNFTYNLFSVNASENLLQRVI